MNRNGGGRGLMNKFPLLSFLIPGLTEDNGFVLQKTLMKFPLKKERRRKEEEGKKNCYTK